ncbi:MAG: NADH-quinone oxidoreductase subunit N, partial [Planctomycetes bacterium]|nr:NADH-quinone oxidoreductase subunit N [Planctomycetota bacterium]
MNATDLIALSPLLIVGLSAVATLLLISLHRNHRAVATLALGGLALAMASIPQAAAVAPYHIAPLMMADGYAFFYSALLLAASFVVGLLSFDYLEQRGEQREEYYVLLLLATLGGLVLVGANHFVSLFLGLEILSVAIYVMVAYARSSPHAAETGIKYLILAGTSSAFMVFGMALVYAQTGTLEFGPIAAQLMQMEDFGLALPGMAMMLVGVGFKLAVVPFHMWTPEVYQGAPVPVTAFVATVSKGAMFALLLRFFAAFEA